MKSKPIENPRFYGCLNCSPHQTTIISKDRLCAVGFGTAELIIDGRSFDLQKEDPPLTLSGIEEKFGQRLDECEEAEIILWGALHGETFELNKADGNWYLTEQNEGFA